MTYVITEPCIGTKDASCVDVCPVDCIHTTADDPQYYIDPNMCIDCAACETVCPVSAIYFEDDVPEDQKRFTAINAEWFESHDTSGAWRSRTERHEEA
jgi:NAD-dependent dihydropyrimidine dehydrogenase PreA subunit